MKVQSAGKQNQIVELQGLRGVAVLLVLLFHFGIGPVSGGYIGVDVFFVISGFIITYILRGRIEASRFSIGDFYKRRFWRLFPALFVACMATYLVAAFLFAPRDLERLSAVVISAIMGLSNFFFYQESGYFDAEAELKPLLHTWSLAVEAQFYLVWPFVVLFLARCVQPRFAALIILSLAAISLLFGLLFAIPNPLVQGMEAMIGRPIARGGSFVFYMSPFRIFEFSAGALLAFRGNWMVRKGWLSATLVLGGLAFILVPAFMYDADTLFPAPAALLPVVGTAMAIAGRPETWLRGLLTNRPLVWFGEISYSLYLVHWPLLALFIYGAANAPSFTVRLALFGTAVGGAYLLYRWVECPLRRGLMFGESMAHGLRTTAASTLLLVSLSVLAHGYYSNGWPWRVPGNGYFGDVERGDVVDCDVCTFNEDRKRVVLLVGDSHAAQYEMAASEIFHDFKVRVFTGPSCFMGDKKHDRAMVDHLEERCDKAKTSFRSYMKNVNEEKLALVIHSQRWHAYRRDYTDETGRLVEQRSKALYREMLDAILKTYRDVTAPVLVVGSTPNTAQECLNRPNPFETNCTSRSVRKTLREVRYFHQVATELLALRKNRFSAHPYEFICASGRCDRLYEGGAIYKDRHHVSLGYSRELLARMTADLRNGGRLAER